MPSRKWSITSYFLSVGCTWGLLSQKYSMEEGEERQLYMGEIW